MNRGQTRSSYGSNYLALIGVSFVLFNTSSRRQDSSGTNETSRCRVPPPKRRATKAAPKRHGSLLEAVESSVGKLE